MSSQMKEKGLAGAINQTSEQIQEFIVLPHESLATLIACWIAGTYAHNAFKHYGLLFIQSRPACEGNARTLWHFIEALSCGDPVAMVGLSGRISKRSNNARLVKRPRAFVGMADLRSPLVEECFHIQMDQDQSQHGSPNVGEIELEIARHAFSLHVHQSHERIKYLYRKCSRQTHLITTFEPSFQAIAIPLLVVAMLADRTSFSSPPIMPQLLAGLRVVAGRRQTVNGEVA